MNQGAKEANQEIKERREAQTADIVQEKLDRIIVLLERLVKRV